MLDKITYDIGIESDNSMDWDNLKISSLAAWILGTTWESNGDSIRRAIENASQSYYDSCQRISTKSLKRIGFLRAFNSRLRLYCYYHEDQENGFVTGEIYFYDTKVEITENTISLADTPNSLLSKIQKGDEVSSIVDINIPHLKDRIIDKAEESEENLKIQMNYISPEFFLKNFPEETWN